MKTPLIGMGFSGVVDREKGTVISCLQPNWKNITTFERKKIEGASVLIDNDANVTALGEKYGWVVETNQTATLPGQVFQRCQFIVCRPGWRELGHIAVDFSERPFACTCGKKAVLKR